MLQNKLKIEILFPELCNLFGDSGNMRYLKKCIPDAEFINTAFNDTPAFVSKKVNMIYMGSSTESSQEKIITRLAEYKEKLKEAIDNDTIILFTGNAMEVLFRYIQTDSGEKIPGVGIFDFYAQRHLMDRFNSLILCRYNNIEITGFKTQFTMTFGDNSDCFFANVERGIGINKTSMLEGIHVHNFFGTNLVGPLLVLNPYFTEHILELMGIENPEIPFKEELIHAYRNRLREFKDNSIKESD